MKDELEDPDDRHARRQEESDKAKAICIAKVKRMCSLGSEPYVLDEKTLRFMLTDAFVSGKLLELERAVRRSQEQRLAAGAETVDLRRRVAKALQLLSGVNIKRRPYKSSLLIVSAMAVLADEEPAGQEGR